MVTPWLQYDGVALAVLAIGLGLVAALAFIIDVLALLPKIGQPAVVFPPSYRSGLRPRLRGPCVWGGVPCPDLPSTFSSFFACSRSLWGL